jgi:tol-pal system-associated acyl-CoA thioesterase
VSAEFSLPIRVYIEDTDAGGIVYYVNYLKYLERCRTEFMRALGMDRAAVPDEGWMFVVSSLALTYRQPARLDDQLEATAEVVAVKGATIRFAQSVKREGSCMVEGDVTIACVDRASGKPRRLSPELKQQLEARMQNKETTT